MSITHVKITSHSDSHVTVAYRLDEVVPGEGDLDIEREFWAPSDGGYVREISVDQPGLLGDQVCTGLSSRGPTLSWDDRLPLSVLVMRELRRSIA